MDFGLRHILGSIKSLGSTHNTDHFGSNLISCIGIGRLGYKLEQNGMSTQSEWNKLWSQNHSNS